jgi:DUF4097 and DUF4098 domain-containing protein YvlB
MLRLMTALLCALAVVPLEAQERPGRAPQTDQTVPVSRVMRLAIDNETGEVVIHVWDKDALRVQARDASRTHVNIRNANHDVKLSADGVTGPAGSVDYDITAPAWMPVQVEGPFSDVTIEGLQSDVSIETVRGDIVLKDGSGSMTAETIEGEIVVEGGRGKMDLSSVNQGIRVTGASGEITAETTNGSITFSRIESSAVEAATLNGNISYDGTLRDKGRYTFTTHNGDIVLAVPDTANATFGVRIYNGEFASALALKGPDSTKVKRGKRSIYVLGTGSADVEMESFGGAIRLHRAGTAPNRRD